MTTLTLATIDTAGHKLTPAAAAAFKRAQAAYGRTFDVESAYRSTAQQEVLYAAYLAGTGNLASKPGTSKHEFGLAVDVNGTAARAWLAAHGAASGWHRTNTEVWHFEYQAATDKHAPTSTSSTSTTLARGSKGATVKALQDGLNDAFPAYSKLAVDGIYGVATESVVKEFQRRVGLVVDGIVGAKTTAALARYGITL